MTRTDGVETNSSFLLCNAVHKNLVSGIRARHERGAPSTWFLRLFPPERRLPPMLSGFLGKSLNVRPRLNEPCHS